MFYLFIKLNCTCSKVTKVCGRSLARRGAYSQKTLWNGRDFLFYIIKTYVFQYSFCIPSIFETPGTLGYIFSINELFKNLCLGTFIMYSVRFWSLPAARLPVHSLLPPSYFANEFVIKRPLNFVERLYLLRMPLLRCIF